MQSNTKTTANKIKDKPINTQQQTDKFEQNIRKKRAIIQKKYVKSIVNKLYIFPRMASPNTSHSSSSSQEEIQQMYNLKSQNVKNRENQTRILEDFFSSQNKNVNKNQVKISKQYLSVRSDNSLHSIQEGRKTLKNKCRKSKNIQISFNTKKKTPSRTKTNSQRKLLAQQYSLDNRIYASTKDNTNRFVVSFRDNKKHQINISLSGRKMKTQIN